MIFGKDELVTILYELIERFEYEIVEFKEAKKDFHFDDIGKYFSAISNEANLKQKQYGWLIFGVTNNGEIIGTNYRNTGRPLDRLKKEIADHTSERITFIEIYECNITINGVEKRVVMFQIPSAVSSIPTAWKGHYFGRDGESLVSLNIYEIEHIRSQGVHDWSKQIIEGATIDDLDQDAIALARENFKKKNANKEHLINEIEKLDDTSFLNKTKVTIDGKITNAALLLLGKSEADHLFAGYKPQITWRLIETSGKIKDYEHFNIPILPAIEKIFAKI